jgi:hypothetical protein
VSWTLGQVKTQETPHQLLLLLLLLLALLLLACLQLPPLLC